MFKIDENWFFWWMNSQLQSKYSWNNESVMWGLSANESDEYLFVMNWQSPFGVVTNWDGIEWRQFGITHSSLNCVFLLKNILVSMNVHWHQEEMMRWIICWFWIDCFNEMDTKQGLSLPLMVMFVKLCL